MQRFLNAREAREIVFVRGTTEAINLVAQAYARPLLRPGDEIVVSILEHHSNFVPWKMACEATGARLRVVPMTDDGELRMDEYERLLGDRTRLVAVGHVSNALGTINPVAEIVRLAHARGIPVLVDGAQAVPHMPVDVTALDCDFYAFSGHKLFGPTGIGVLYGKARPDGPDAALAGRRRHDQLGHARRGPLQHAAGEVRGRHARHRRRHRPRRGHRLPRTASTCDGGRRARGGADALRRGAAVASSTT